MSLRVWLPLNGTLDNQGLDQVTITNNGATVDNNGKIGKCYSFNGSNNYFIGNPAPLNSQIVEWSYCCWFKPNRLHTGCLFSNRISVSETGITIFYYNNYIYFDDGIRWSFIPSIAISIENWNHLVFVRKINCKQFYLNGVLINETSTVGTNNNNMNSTHFTIGMSQSSNTNASGNALNGKLNDVRIYDHALSPMEVKQISQGLILHYPLNRNGWGQENLLPCGGIYIQSSPWITTSNRTDGYAFVTNSGFEATPGKTYTISVECDGNLYSYHGGTHNPSDKHWTFWAYISNINTTANWQNGEYDTPRNLTSSNNNYRKIGNTHVWTITLTDSQKYIGLRTNSYSDGSTNLTLHWWNMKVEEGDKFTGWSPNSSSALAITMGLNNNVEYDTSGYGNNGTKVGTFSYDSDTPKYNVSTAFNGNDTYISVDSNFSPFFKGGDIPFTFSFWIYRVDSTRAILFGDYGLSGTISFNIELTTDHILRLYWNGSPDYKPSTAVLTLNAWSHIGIVYTGSSILFYINGELKGTYSSALSTKSKISGNYYLGRDSRTGTTALKGNLSDFRIYATALSADDIKSLYNNSAYIDNQGNIYGAVYEEV